jgi:hypothetical protein
MDAQQSQNVLSTREDAKYHIVELTWDWPTETPKFKPKPMLWRITVNLFATHALTLDKPSTLMASLLARDQNAKAHSPDLVSILFLFSTTKRMTKSAELSDLVQMISSTMFMQPIAHSLLVICSNQTATLHTEEEVSPLTQRPSS